METRTIKSLAVLCSADRLIATDRLIASNMGYTAVQALYQFYKGATKMIPLSADLEGKNESTDAQLELIQALVI